MSEKNLSEATGGDRRERAEDNQDAAAQQNETSPAINEIVDAFRMRLRCPIEMDADVNGQHETTACNRGRSSSTPSSSSACPSTTHTLASSEALSRPSGQGRRRGDDVFCVYYGRSIVRHRSQRTDAAVPGSRPTGRHVNPSSSSGVLLFSPVHLTLQDGHHQFHREYSRLSESHRSVLERELSQHPLDQRGEDMLAAVFIDDVEPSKQHGQAEEDGERLQRQSTADSTSDCIGGIPEIYLLPSASCDHFVGRGCKTNVVEDYPLARDDLATSDRDRSPAFSGGSSDDGAKNVSYFRDTPRGEPMGSESSVLQAPPAAAIARNCPDQDKKRVAMRGSSVRDIVDDQSERRLWLREDVEGADNEENAAATRLIPSDNEELDGGRQQYVNVRPPLVGQSEDSRDALITPAAVQLDSGDEQTAAADELVPAHSRFSVEIAADSSTTDRPVRSRREFYRSLVEDDDDDDDDDDAAADDDDEEEKQNSSVESTDAEHVLPPKGSGTGGGGGYQSDHRASSPSVMSVASSVASSKRLEWDSGADIGYGGPKVLYGRLSTLERMAIGSFFKRTEPEGKSALGKDRAGGLRPANSNDAAAAVASIGGQQHDNRALTVASLEDVILSIAEGHEAATADDPMADPRYLPKLGHDDDDDDDDSGENDDDDRDTEDEIADYCRKKLALKERRSTGSGIGSRSRSPELMNECTEEDTSVRTPRTLLKHVNDAFMMSDGRSSSMTDLSRANLIRQSVVAGHSRSALDIAAECGHVRRHHTRQLLSSPGSMFGSSSSSSTVVGAVPPSSSSVTDRVRVHVQSTPFVQQRFCSTALQSDGTTPSRPDFGTPMSLVSTPPGNVTVADDMLVDTFDQKLMQAQKLIAQMGSDPRWTTTQRRRLVQALLEAVNPSLDIESSSRLDEAVGGVRAVSCSGCRSTSSSDLDVKATFRPEPRGGSQGGSSSADNLVEKKSLENDVAAVSGNTLPEDPGEGHVAWNEVRGQDGKLTVPIHRNASSHSKCDSSSRTSQHSSASSGSVCPMAKSTQARRYVSLSSSDRSESTLETIREQKRKDPQRHHHHHHHQQQPLEPAEVSCGTLASSFEFYTVPMHFRDVDDASRIKAPRKKTGDDRKSRSSWSSVHLATASSSTVSTESGSGTPTPAVVTTICTSETSSNVCVQSSSSEQKTTSTTTTTTRDSSGRQVDNLNLEGLSVVKYLVRRQRESYVRKLKREMDWLERIEAILVGDYAQKQQHQQVRVKVRESRKATSSGSAAVGRLKRIVTSSSNQNSSKSKILHQVHSTGSRTKDFGQCFPTPQQSENDMPPLASPDKTTVALQKNMCFSIGIQTSESILNMPKTRTASRPVVNIPLTATRVRRITKATMPSLSSTGVVSRNACGKHPPVAWFVPFADKSSRIRIAARSREQAMRGRADGAHAYVASIAAIPGHAGRNLSLQEAFKLFKSDAIRRSTTRQDILKARERLRLDAPAPRIPLTTNKRGRMFKRVTKPLLISAQHHNPQRRFMSQRQMHDQTEKLYQALSEVTKRQELKQREDTYRTNRQMAEIFKKRLQEKVLRGKVSMPNTQKCI